MKIAALDGAGAAFGLYEGQPLAEARALAPSLCAAAIDRAADAADFETLLAALLRYSPLVGSPGFGTAFVDIAGSSHLFGGEAALAEDALVRLRKIGLEARAAVAGTPGCAEAVARSGGVGLSSPACGGGVREADGGGKPQDLSSRKELAPSGSPGLTPGSPPSPLRGGGRALLSIIPPGLESAALAPLPVAALRIDPEIAADLERLGLKTIGAVTARSRKALGKRFGAALLERLDAAAGGVFAPISPIAPPTDHSAAAVLAEPVFSVEAALLLAERLARALCGKLEAAGLGARRFEFSLHRMDMSFETVGVVLGAPSRAPAPLLRLLRLKLEKGDRPLDPGFGFESFRLSAFETAPVEARPFAGEEGEREEDWTAVKDSFVNRLGAAAVFHLAAAADHLPERAETRASALAASIPWTDETPERPLSLLDPPQPVRAVAPLPDGPPVSFRRGRIPHRVRRAAGPERILGDWRKGEDFLRDYYRVEDEEGRRYWLFREGFYERGAKWFLHGFFA